MPDTSTLSPRSIIERCALNEGVAVDSAKSVIRGVKILGYQSKNSRVYTRDAVREALPMYEGIAVNVDHGDHPSAPRSYESRIGNLANVELKDDGLYGDLQYNPKHALAEQLAWDAENAPGNVGLSHNVRAETRYDNGIIEVTKIVQVVSVDLVADPATTNGLFESTSPSSSGVSSMPDSNTITIEEQQRRNDVREAYKKVGLDDPDIRDRAIDENWTPEYAELMFRRQAADLQELHDLRNSRPQAVDNRIRESAGVSQAEVFEARAALLVSGGDEDRVTEAYGEQVAEQAFKRPFLPQECVEHILRTNGRSVPSSRTELARLGLEGTAFYESISTMSLPGVLGNAMGKMLLPAMRSLPATWRSIASKKNLHDFKEATAYQTRLTGDLEEMPKDGEIKHAGIAENSYTVQLATHSKMFSLTRQDVINDDAGVFDGIALGFSRMANRKISDLFHGTLIDQSGHFTAERNNLLTGADSALSITSLGTGVTRMRTMRDEEGHDQDLEPAILLCPPSLEATARAILNSEFIENLSGTGATATGNSMRGIVKLVVEPRLENTAKFSGASSTAWYLFASPMDQAMFACFLDGVEAPKVDYFGLDHQPNRLEVVWRVYLDFGAGLGDYRAAIKSDGQ